MYFCIKGSIGIQGEVGRVKKAFNPTVIYSTDRSKAVVLMLFLVFVALWFSHCFLFLFFFCFFFSVCVVMQAL